MTPSQRGKGRLERRSSAPRGLALAACALLASFELHAAVDCSIATSGVAFGVYDAALPTPADSAGTVTIRCTHVSGGASRINYAMLLSTGGSGSYAQRQLRAGPLLLNYNLYGDVGRTRIWGNGSGGTFVASGAFTVGPGVGNRTQVGTHTLYGRLPALQDALPGDYADSILVTLEF
jgi:spore coat protein U-like protein